MMPQLLIAAAELPDPQSSASIGWLLAVAAAAVAAIGTVLYFLRREARMQEPSEERTVRGGPVITQPAADHLPRHEHNDFRATIERSQAEIWQVVNGLRLSIARIESDVATLRALREANGERLTELSNDVKAMAALVHRLSAIVETKLEGKR